MRRTNVGGGLVAPSVWGHFISAAFFGAWCRPSFRPVACRCRSCRYHPPYTSEGVVEVVSSSRGNGSSGVDGGSGVVEFGNITITKVDIPPSSTIFDQ